MALAMNPSDERVHPLVAIILTVIWRFGFHPQKNSVDNDNIRTEFARRLTRWADRFLREEMVDRMWRPLKGVLTTERNPVDRKKVLELRAIHELVLACSCACLAKSYSGVSDQDALLALKREIAWLLERRGYLLPHAHALHCPLLISWRDHGFYWKLVSTEGRDVLFRPGDAEQEEFPHVASCAECAAHSYHAASK